MDKASISKSIEHRIFKNTLADLAIIEIEMFICLQTAVLSLK